MIVRDEAPYVLVVFVVLSLVIWGTRDSGVRPCATGNGHAAYGKSTYVDPITASKRTTPCK